MRVTEINMQMYETQAMEYKIINNIAVPSSKVLYIPPRVGGIPSTVACMGVSFYICAIHFLPLNV